MLVLRNEQMEVFRKAALASFESKMMVHLSGFAKRHCEVIGEENVRYVIRLGIERSALYGFTDRGAIQLFLELMFMFGSYFDTDPQLPWAAQILQNREADEEMACADRLYHRTMDYLNAVAGPGNAYTIRALKKIRMIAAQSFTFTSENFVGSLMTEMADAYPEKYRYVGKDALKTLIERGIDSAKTHKVKTDRSLWLFCVLMFALGHGFANDPLFPWIARTLTDSALTDPDQRAKKLEGRAMAYLDRVLAHFGER
jgi:hypothetical protein